MRILALALLAALPTVAHANPFDLFGAGARAQGMGGAVTASATDHMAAFHNPGGMAVGGRVLGFGITGSFNRTNILLSPRPAGYDPPDYAHRLNARSDTEDPAGVAGATVGLTLPLWTEKLAIGAAFFFPFDGFARMNTVFPDEQEQYYTNGLRQEIIGQRAGGEVMAVALSYRLNEWFSAGMGLLILPAVQTVNDVYTPNTTDPATSKINVSIEQGARSGITAGALIQPLDWLGVGVAFHDEVFLELEGFNRIQLKGEPEPVIQPLRVITHYSPPRLAGAVAVRAASGFMATAEAVWHGWSNYLDERGNLAGFEDTVDLKLGTEYPLRNRTYVRAGLGWQPSPVPPQTGRTNFVDNDRVTVSVGAGREFLMWGEEMTVDLSLQAHSLLTAETHKRVRADGRYPACVEGERRLCDEVPDLAADTPLQPAAPTQGLQTGNPGFPGFTSGGYVVSAGVDVKWHF